MADMIDEYDTPEDEESLSKYIGQVIDDCEDYSTQQRDERDSALKYYDGIMDDLKPPSNRSSVVSCEIRKTVKRLMPSVMRTVLGKDNVIEYHPAAPGAAEAEAAEAASAYVNHVIIPRDDVEDSIYDAVFDALILKTGILHWDAYDKQEVKHYRYTNQPNEVLEFMSQEPGVEIMDVESREETDPESMEQGGRVMVHDFMVKRTSKEVHVSLDAIARGAFLISSDAKSIKDAHATGHTKHITRSELVSMGFDRDVVNGLAVEMNRSGSGNQEHENDDDAYRGEDQEIWSYGQSRTQATQLVLVYYMYIKIDLDKDGIAEVIKIICAKKGGDEAQQDGTYVLLDVEPVASAPYSKVTVERTAHQFEGHSLSEDVRHFQRVKTALLRGTLDNIYWQNFLQPYVVKGALINPDDLLNPEFGRPIFLNDGIDVRTAVQFGTVPFVGDKSFQMQEYLDQEVQQLTGLNDRSTGLDPESLQNVTATATAVLNESGLAQSQMMIKQLVKGIKTAFQGVLGLIIAHADKPQMVQVQGKWVSFDPRRWDSNMQCKVNIGLGTGSRESDISILQLVLSIQKEIIGTMGADNPFVKADQLYNTIQRIVEISGLPSVAPYFTSPDPEAVKRIAEVQSKDEDEGKYKHEAQLVQMKAQSDAQMMQMKAQSAMQMKQIDSEAKMALESQKTQLQQQMEILKTEAQREVEQAQMQADVVVQQHDNDVKAELELRKLVLDEQKLALNRQIHEDEMALRVEELKIKRKESENEPGILRP